MEKDSCDVPKQFQTLIDTISKHAPLGPESHSSDASEDEYLYYSVFSILRQREISKVDIVPRHCESLTHFAPL